MVMTIDIPRWGGFFNVPISVAEKYLKLSSAEQLKVLLFVLSNGTPNIDCSYVADALSMSDEAVEDALHYWHSVGVITIEGCTATVITRQTETVEKPIVESSTNQPEKKRAVIKYRPTDIEKLAKSDSEISTLFEQIQKTLCRTIKDNEQMSLINLHGFFGFPVSTIIMLCEYCHSIGKDQFAYIEKVAKDWYENGIIEPKDAEPEIKRLSEYHSYESELKRLLGLPARTTKSQKEYFEKWHRLNFSVELVDYAGELSIDNTSKHAISFEYMDSILTRWNESSIKTVAQAKKDSDKWHEENDKPRSNKKPSAASGERKKAGSKLADIHRERIMKLLED